MLKYLTDNQPLLEELPTLRNNTFQDGRFYLSISFFSPPPLSLPLPAVGAIERRQSGQSNSPTPYCPLGTSLDHLVDNSLWTVPGLSIWQRSSRGTPCTEKRLQTKCAALSIHTYKRPRRRKAGEENTKCSFKHLYLLSIYFLSSQNLVLFVCLSLLTLTPSFLPYFYSQLILVGGPTPSARVVSSLYVEAVNTSIQRVCLSGVH